MKDLDNKSDLPCDVTYIRHHRRRRKQKKKEENESHRADFCLTSKKGKSEHVYKPNLHGETYALNGIPDMFCSRTMNTLKLERLKKENDYLHQILKSKNLHINNIENELE